MTDVFNEPGWARGTRALARLSTALKNAAGAAGPPLLFGLRLWASVCLALYVAFWLELDNAFWAGTTAAIVCQPHLGASLRKGWYRMIGTLVGAVAIVVLTACFPQDRAPFLVALALWCAACALVATLLHNFASYAAALAGYTAAIIAADELGATGGPNADAVFLLAVLPRQRDLHRHCKRRRRSRRDRFRRRPAPAGRVICGPVGRNHGPVYRHVGAGRAGNAGDATCPARARPAGQSRSTRSSTRRRENPLKSVIIRRYCRELWTACSPPRPAGAR